MSTSSQYQRLDDLLAPMIDHITQETDTPTAAAVPTGFEELDELTRGGLPRGQLTVVGGLPGAGKTTLTLDFARHAAINTGLETAFFSLDRSDVELTTRILCAEADVRGQDVLHNKLEDSERQTLAATAARIKDAPLMISAPATLTGAEIVTTATELTPDLIIVDDIHSVVAEREYRSQSEEVGSVVRLLRQLAKRLDAAVVVVAQAQRSTAYQAGTDGTSNPGAEEPTMGDLRDHDGLVDDASVVVLLHRHDLLSGESAAAGDAELIVAKNSGGAVGRVPVRHELDYSRFA